jgi:glycosyltransferase involved in cell wall biosynthesis
MKLRLLEYLAWLACSGGLKEIVADGESGLLMRRADSRSLAEALLALLTNEPLRLRLAEGDWRLAQVFSLERWSYELLQLFLERTENAE